MFAYNEHQTLPKFANKNEIQLLSSIWNTISKTKTKYNLMPSQHA